MSSLKVTPQQALDWVRWWVEGARQAEASWQLGAEGIAPGLLARLRDESGPWLDQRLGMTAAWPVPPNPGLLPLLALDSRQWQRVLRLAVAVCAGSQPQVGHGLDDAERVWCRRLGRALQPGHWLPGQWRDGSVQVQGLRLMRAWVGEPVWQRLRLRFVRALVEDAERQPFAGLPGARLTALWQAVGWYALTFIPQGMLHADPSQPELESPPGAA
ncbi:hypothetical protein ACQKQA_03520 [Pseudomonas sp. NPDC089530]|uniref:hypothetical protein n=1 Tax=Pseudomonas sp. NPDC089530 TaxID=3390651 RepID=UPI003CFD98A0